jgi:hypothetical protein
MVNPRNVRYRHIPTDDIAFSGRWFGVDRRQGATEIKNFVGLLHSCKNKWLQTTEIKDKIEA